MFEQAWRRVDVSLRNRGPVARPVARTEFNRAVGADIVAAPRNVVAIGWVDRSQGWITAGGDLGWARRLRAVVRHLDRALAPGPDTPPLWLLCCLSDGWRERTDHTATYRWVDPGPDLDNAAEWSGPPGTLPRMSPTRDWIACFSAHRDDPSAVLLPEAHYLIRGQYRSLLGTVTVERRPWRARIDSAVYAGGDHHGPGATATGPALRRALKEIVERENLEVDVFLGSSVSRRRQLRYKLVIDVDGYVRTWDAWAWKLASGSAVLSPDSLWETRFTRACDPWEHFIPLAADLSDLAERLAWCRAHDDECRAIGARARRHAYRIYERSRVELDTRNELFERLGLR